MPVSSSPTGPGVGVLVGLGVAVLVGLGVVVLAGVGVAVLVAVGVGVSMGSGVWVGVDVGVLVGVGVSVGVSVKVGVAVCVGVCAGRSDSAVWVAKMPDAILVAWASRSAWEYPLQAARMVPSKRHTKTESILLIDLDPPFPQDRG